MFKRIVIVFFMITLVFSALTLTPQALQKTEAIQIMQNQETTDISATSEPTEAPRTVETVETIEINESMITEMMEDVTEETMMLEEVDEKSIFGKDIGFTHEYICSDDVMPYALYTPTNTETSEKMPLIVWLHGSGEINVYKDVFLNSGLPFVLNNWQTEGFNAYILCPHLTGSWNSGRWDTPRAKDNLQALLNKFIIEYNIDVEKIVIVGHSLGGQGTLYMAQELDCFSKCVVLSGYCPQTGIIEVEIPIVGYVGKASMGEDVTSINFMKGMFAEKFVNQSVDASHGGVPQVVFSMDTNNNNRSDLIEWFFEEMEL